jgi:hypothetical protein
MSSDGIHPSVYRDTNTTQDQSCWLYAGPLDYGYNVRNYTALAMLSRLRRY